MFYFDLIALFGENTIYDPAVWKEITLFLLLGICLTYRYYDKTSIGRFYIVIVDLGIGVDCL
jgi:hypothetical protein